MNKDLLIKAINREKGRIKVYKENCESESKIQMSEALIKAAEKQIPKKSIGSMIFEESECSVCNGNVFNEKYCPNCGQKMDWSGEDD